MPLIKHSPEFLAKKAARDAIKNRLTAEQKALRLEQQIVEYVEQVKEFQNLPKDEENQKRYEELLISLVKNNVPILQFLTLREAYHLREILRFAKLSGEFTKTADEYRLIDSIQRKNYENIFHLQQLEEYGIGSYYRRYVAKSSAKMSPIGRPLASQVDPKTGYLNKGGK